MIPTITKPRAHRFKEALERRQFAYEEAIERLNGRQENATDKDVFDAVVYAIGCATEVGKAFIPLKTPLSSAVADMLRRECFKVDDGRVWL